MQCKERVDFLLFSERWKIDKNQDTAQWKYEPFVIDILNEFFSESVLFLFSVVTIRVFKRVC